MARSDKLNRKGVKLTQRDPAQRPHEPDRPCNGCTGCCQAFAIPALNKPTMVMCHFVGAIPELGGKQGCTIQEDKPDECDSFQCMWVWGYGGERHRPDKLGLVAKLRADENTVDVLELWPDAAESPAAKAFLNWMLTCEHVDTISVHEFWWFYFGNTGPSRFIWYLKPVADSCNETLAQA